MNELSNTFDFCFFDDPPPPGQKSQETRALWQAFSGLFLQLYELTGFPGIATNLVKCLTFRLS